MVFSTFSGIFLFFVKICFDKNIVIIYMNISKVRNYKKNEILDKIIEIVVPKKRSSILLRFLRYKKKRTTKKIYNIY